jgi:hypothetical protein
MEDLVLHPSWEVDWAASEPAWLVQLRQEVAEFRTEGVQLRRDNLELRHQAGYWRVSTPRPSSGSSSWNRKSPSFAASIAISRINSSAVSQNRRRRLIAPIDWTTPTTLKSRSRAVSGVAGQGPNDAIPAICPRARICGNYPKRNVSARSMVCL